MGLGTTWWHGSLVKRLDSYGPEDGFIPRRDEEKELREWEATQAWEGQKGKLHREASALLRESGHKVKWDGFLSVDVVKPKAVVWTEQELLLIAVIVILME